MHNWLEGVLQHHFRVKFAVGLDFSESDNVDVEVATEPDLDRVDEDMDVTLEDELALLQQESLSNMDTPSQLKRVHSMGPLIVNASTESESDNDTNYQPDADSDDNDMEIDDALLGEAAECVFTEVEMMKIRQCIRELVLPSWVERPPVNLGEKSHGKLKADNWFILFSVVLSMVLPELWYKSHSRRKQALLQNLYDLITCTNIVCSFSTSISAANNYDQHYLSYRQSLQTLFPHSSSVPNHHYAMHNGDMLRFWGPLMNVSEFAYERDNHILQNINTNNHPCKDQSQPVHQLRTNLANR